MPDISVVVYFIGLTVFTNQIDTDLGVKAILPRVVHTSPIATAHHRTSSEPQYQIAQLTGVPAAPLRPTRHVEDHEAVLVFPTSAYHASSSWPKTGVILNADGTQSQWSYATLDRDLVRFISNSAALDDLGGAAVLPNLAVLCSSKMQTLRNEYRPPYTGAAAVFDITHGTLESCRSPIPNTTSDFRLDTRLLLTAPAAPYFTVSASTSKTQKELRLTPTNGNVELLVANVPKRYLVGSMGAVNPAALNGVPHDQALFAMGSGSGTCPSLKTWLNTNGGSLSSVGVCNWTNLPSWKRAGGAGGANAAGPGTPLPEGIAMSSFECSNTQWP